MRSQGAPGRWMFMYKESRRNEQVNSDRKTVTERQRQKDSDRKDDVGDTMLKKVRTTDERGDH